MEEESSVEAEKTAEPGPVTRQPHVMACYHNYLAHFQVKLVSLDTYTFWNVDSIPSCKAAPLQSGMKNTDVKMNIMRDPSENPGRL